MVPIFSYDDIVIQVQHVKNKEYENQKQTTWIERMSKLEEKIIEE